MPMNKDTTCLPDTWTLLTDQGPERINLQVVERGRTVRLQGTSGDAPDPEHRGGYRVSSEHGASGFDIERDFPPGTTHVWAFSGGARATVYVFHA